MLLVRHRDDRAVEFYCQTCEYMCSVRRKVSHDVHLDRKPVDDVLGDTSKQWVDQTDGASLSPVSASEPLRRWSDDDQCAPHSPLSAVRERPSLFLHDPNSQCR